MLKRQRAHSPPPPAHYDEEDCVAGPSMGVQATRAVKRRRTVAPVLSTEHRGWNISPSDDEQDDDRSVSEDEAVEDEVARSALPLPSTAVTNYASTNRFLHDLHLRHHQRFCEPKPLLPSKPKHSMAHMLVPEHKDTHARVNEPYRPPPLIQHPVKEEISVKHNYEDVNRYV
jgi:hypothetical protein